MLLSYMNENKLRVNDLPHSVKKEESAWCGTLLTCERKLSHWVDIFWNFTHVFSLFYYLF